MFVQRSWWLSSHHCNEKQNCKHRRLPLSYLSGHQVDDLEAVLDNANSEQLFAVVSSMHHQGVDQTLHNWTLSLAETLGCVSAAAVGKVLSVLLLDGNVILQEIINFFIK